jgi:hypothetical protein
MKRAELGTLELKNAEDNQRVFSPNVIVIVNCDN